MIWLLLGRCTLVLLVSRQLSLPHQRSLQSSLLCWPCNLLAATPDGCALQRAFAGTIQSRASDLVSKLEPVLADCLGAPPAPPTVVPGTSNAGTLEQATQELLHLVDEAQMAGDRMLRRHILSLVDACHVINRRVGSVDSETKHA